MKLSTVLFASSVAAAVAAAAASADLLVKEEHRRPTVGVAENAPCFRFTGNNREDCTFLTELYDHAGGRSWTNNTNWNTATSYCTWFGVTCSDDGTRINKTEVPSNNVHGPLPASVAKTFLWGLDVSGNQVTGPLPPMPSTIWGMNFRDNAFSGTIPDSYGNLTNLQLLGLPSNKLEGQIPQSLAGLTSLRVMDVSGNQLSGVQDQSLCTLVDHLQHCIADGNDFKCPLPACLKSECNATCQ